MSSSTPAAQSDWMKKANQSKEENQGAIVPGAGGKQQGSGLYSSIVGSLQAQNTESRATRGDNPFKYSKEEMLQVYSALAGSADKTSQVPLDFERYDQVTTSKPVQPAALNDLTADEKALLAGNINSEPKSRRSEQTEFRQNGRRDGRNGNRDTRKQDSRRTIESNGRQSVEQSESATEPVASTTPETSRDSFVPTSGRHTSRLATMGVFDTGVNTGAALAVEDPSKWKEDKEDDDVLNDATRQNDNSSQEVDRLTEIYSGHSLASIPTKQSVHSYQRSFGDQSYNPLSNGMPDLLSKPQNHSNSAFGSANQHQASGRTGFQGATPSPGIQIRQEQPPMTARVMVMPDKLKWQYRDPTGQNQGPFSGLEMHDWYKAGFFQPNLLVKREEDEEFEPLSILVRRIGNQREPFLVPLPSRVSSSASTSKQADGQDSWSNGQGWAGGMSSASSNGGQPPFPQSFPSFGTTLTAEQQNALERRKQEEQYLMHRQREFLQQQQMAQQMAAQRLLHHQNPYGGQSPYAYGMDRRASPFSSGSERQGSMSSFDMGAAAASANGNGAGPAGAGGGGQHGGGGWNGHPPSFQGAPRGQYTDFGVGIFDNPKSEMTDQILREHGNFLDSTMGSKDPRTSSQLRTEPVASLQQPKLFDQYGSRSTIGQQSIKHNAQAEKTPNEESSHFFKTLQSPVEPRLSIFGDVTSHGADEIVSNQPIQEMTNNSLEQGRESTSLTEPEVHSSFVTPNLSVAAPWAAAASTKGKSIRDIQETEAQRDAQRRQIERKLAQESQAQEEAVKAQNFKEAAPSLNLSWANTEPAAASMAAPWKASSNTSRKTLAQIQQEETAARKVIAATQAQQTALVQAGGSKSQPVLGTRYVDTAAKTSGASWATVGAGGRVASPAPPQRSDMKQMNAGAMGALPKQIPVSYAPVATPARTPSNPDAISAEFLAWARSSLKDLNDGVNFAEFLQLLLSFGTNGSKDTREIISDSIYANSATLDGRRFADEFCKRRKEDLKNPDGQNKSISEWASTLASSGGSNGWSDVVKAKKPEVEEDQWNSSFKVQSGKGNKKRK